MSAAHNFLTPERFESLYANEKPNVEYWFGRAIQKSMPTSLHSAVALIVSMLLLKRGWRALPEVRLKISQLAHPVPDVVASSKPFQDPYPTEPFDLCVEILSPRDKLVRLVDKAAHYLDWGIRTVWIIDPQKRTAFSMSIENPQPVPIGMADFLRASSDEDQISMLLSELFAEAEKAGLIDETR